MFFSNISFIFITFVSQPKKMSFLFVLLTERFSKSQQQNKVSIATVLPETVKIKNLLSSNKQTYY